jgi:Phasin protein
MTRAKRRAVDLRKAARTLTTAGTTAAHTGELALAAGRVVAARQALGLEALAQPLTADHAEFARMISEKVAAFSDAALAAGHRSAKIAQQATRFAATDATLAAGAALRLWSCRSPADLFALQSRFAAAWFDRAASRSIAVASAATNAQRDMLAPIHAAATGNDRRLTRKRR